MGLAGYRVRVGVGVPWCVHAGVKCFVLPHGARLGARAPGLVRTGLGAAQCDNVWMVGAVTCGAWGALAWR